MISNVTVLRGCSSDFHRRTGWIIAHKLGWGFCLAEKVNVRLTKTSTSNHPRSGSTRHGSSSGSSSSPNSCVWPLGCLHTHPAHPCTNARAMCRCVGHPPTCTHGTPSGRHGSGAHAWDPHLPRGLDLEQRQLFHRRPCRAARGLGIQRQRRRKMNGSIDEQLGCPKRLKHPSEGGWWEPILIWWVGSVSI
jgi:hypothetical protein